MSTNTIYCIQCETMTKITKIANFYTHVKDISGGYDYPPEFAWCEMKNGIAYCPPPETDNEYFDWLFTQEEIPNEV